MVAFRRDFVRWACDIPTFNCNIKIGLPDHFDVHLLPNGLFSELYTFCREENCIDTDRPSPRQPSKTRPKDFHPAEVHLL